MNISAIRRSTGGHVLNKRELPRRSTSNPTADSWRLQICSSDRCWRMPAYQMTWRPATEPPRTSAARFFDPSGHIALIGHPRLKLDAIIAVNCRSSRRNSKPLSLHKTQGDSQLQNGHKMATKPGGRRIHGFIRSYLEIGSGTVRPAAITAKTALYLCSVTLISLMAGECRAGTEVAVANQPKVWSTAAEGVCRLAAELVHPPWSQRLAPV